MRVLIIDDDELRQFQMKEILSRVDESMIIKQVYSYKEAKSVFSIFSPDSVILDLPIFDDSRIMLIQMFKLLKPSVKVIVMVNSPTSHFKKICLENEVDDFFDKSNIKVLGLC